MENNLNYINQSIIDSLHVKKKLLNDSTLERILAVANACIDSLKNGNRILLAGNGGSAADSQHIAAEFVSRFMYDRPGLPAIALTTDTSMLTAIGNDYGYERVFERQLEANGKKGDIFFGITTSGNSPNILRAINRCKDLGITTVGLSGESGKIHELCDLMIAVPSSSTPRIQECHILIGHIICGLAEINIFPRK